MNKKITVLAVLLSVLTLSACNGNYPSSARAHIDSGLRDALIKEPSMVGEAGVLYFKRDSVLRAKDYIKEYDSVIDSKENYTGHLSLQGKEAENLTDAINTYKERIANVHVAWEKQFTEEKTKAEKNINEFEERLEAAKVNKLGYDEYIKKYTDELDRQKKELKKTQNLIASITKEVIDEFNKNIVEQELSIRKISNDGFKYDWKSNNKSKCGSISYYVTVATKPENNTCYYIKLPSKELAGFSGEKLLVKNFYDVLSANNKKGSLFGAVKGTLRSDIKITKKEIKKAHIRAENKFGSSYRRLIEAERKATLNYNSSVKKFEKLNDAKDLKAFKELFTLTETNLTRGQYEEARRVYLDKLSNTILQPFSTGEASLTEEFDLEGDADFLILYASVGRTNSFLKNYYGVAKNLMGGFGKNEDFVLLDMIDPYDYNTKEELTLSFIRNISEYDIPVTE